MYFVTCFQKIEIDKLGWLDVGASRTFGYFKNFKVADESVRNNSCDICERLYDYAVIENIEEGLYPIVKERWFYKYDEDKDKYYPIEEPKEFKQYCNIALG